MRACRWQNISREHMSHEIILLHIGRPITFYAAIDSGIKNSFKKLSIL